MVAPKKPAVKNDKKATAKSGKKGLPLFVIILLLIIGLAALPVTIIFLAGMVPTYVMMFTEKPGRKNGVVSIGVLNFVGCAYVALVLVKKGFNLDYAIALLSDPMNWTAMFGGAGLGYALHSIIPPIVAHVLAIIAESRISKLKNHQQELKKNWGNDVGG